MSMNEIFLSEEDFLSIIQDDPEDDDEYTATSERTQDSGRHQCALDSLRDDQKNKRGLRAPRKRLDVREAMEKDELLKPGQHFPHRSELEMRCREYQEASRISSPIKPLNALFMRMQSEELQRCLFKFSASYSTQSKNWTIKKFVPHKALCACRKKGQLKCSTPYEAEDLARIEALKEAVNTDTNVQPKTLQGLLNEYLHDPLHATKLHRLKEILKEELIGSPQEQVTLVRATLKALEAEGHHTELQLGSCLQVKAILLRQRQAQHEQQQKNVLQAQKVAWSSLQTEVEAEIEQLFADVEADTQFVVSWSVAFNPCVKMLHHIPPVLFSDATHVRHASGGMIYCHVGQDADHHIVPISHTYHIGHECKSAWLLAFAFLKRVCPSVEKDFILIMDGIMSNFKNCGFRFLLCSKHKRDSIKAPVDKDAYVEAVTASNTVKLEGALAKMSVAFRTKLLTAFKQEQLFMSKCKGSFGHHCQSTVESHNHQLLSARDVCPGSGDDQFTCIILCMLKHHAFSHAHM